MDRRQFFLTILAAFPLPKKNHPYTRITATGKLIHSNRREVVLLDPVDQEALVLTRRPPHPSTCFKFCPSGCWAVSYLDDDHAPDRWSFRDPTGALMVPDPIAQPKLPGTFASLREVLFYVWMHQWRWTRENYVFFRQARNFKVVGQHLESSEGFA